MSTAIRPPPAREEAPRSSSPYQGLQPYAQHDAGYFFGREHWTRLLRANLIASRLKVLYAPSGVGKSSVLQAGVVHSLWAGLRSGRDRGFLPVVVRNWSADPIAEIVAAVKQSVSEAPHADGDADTELTGVAGVLDSAARATRSKLLLVLDQFEEFMLYHGARLAPEFDDGPAIELAGVLSNEGLRANFLIAIREDAFTELDKFTARVPRLLERPLRLTHLDSSAGKRAMEMPLERWNADHPDERMDLEPELTEAVLAQVSTGAIELGRAGAGGAAGASGTIEAPFLQLVLTRIWDEERAAGSALMRRTTLDRLGGATEIVRTHLDREMSQLSGEQQDVAAAVFHRLVTPSGAKVALRVIDLAAWTDVDEAAVEKVLQDLSQGDRRIVRAIPHPTRPGAPPSYEIFHDVLTEPVLDWRARHETERHARELVARAKEEARQRWRRRLRFGLLTVGSAIVALIAVLAVIALQQAGEARDQSRAAEAGRLAATGRSQIESRPELAILLAREALNRRRTAGAVAALRAALVSDRSLAVLPAGDKVVTDVEVSPDRSRILAFGEDGHVRVWRLDEQKLLFDAPASDAKVTSAAFSPDGRRIVTSSADGRAAIWDAQTGRERIRLQGAGNSWASWNTSGSRVMAGTPDGVTVWDAATGRRVRSLRDDAKLASARWLPRHGNQIVTATETGVVRVRNVRTGATVTSLDTHHPTSDLRVDDRGTAVLAIPAPGSTSVTIWDLVRDDAVPVTHPIGAYPQIVTAVFDHAGDRVATAGLDDRVWIWDAHTGAVRAILTGHGSYIIDIEFGPDDTTVATAGNDHAARTWDAKTGEPLNVLRGHSTWIAGLAFVGGDVLATAGGDGDVRLWRPNWTQLAVRDVGSQIETASFSRSGRLVAAATLNGVEVVDLTRRLVGRRLRVGETNSAALSPDERLVIVAGATISRPSVPARVFDVHSGRRSGLPLAVPGARNGAVTAAFSPDGKLILTGHTDGAARLWSADTHRLVRRLGPARTPDWNGSRLIDVAFSPDGRRAATVGMTGVTRLFDTATGRELRAFAAKKTTPIDRPLNAVAFQPRGNVLATGGADALVLLWDTTSGRAGSVSHDDAVTSIAFTPGGSLVATASMDGTARLWDARTAQPLGVLVRQAAPVKSIAFNADGKRFMTADQAGLIRVYECGFCGSVAEVEREARLRVKRDLTPEERRLYVDNPDG